MCVWVEDADRLEVDSPELDIVYQNRFVQSFLNSQTCLGISAIKGLGKTFLLKVKRKRMESLMSISLPRNKPVDTVGEIDLPSIDRSLHTTIHQYPFWEKIWKVAICVVIIKHVYNGDLAQAIDRPRGLSRPTLALFEIRNINSCPSQVLTHVLGMQLPDVLEVFADLPILMGALTDINKSVSVYIDKIDQAFKHLTASLNPAGKDVNLPRNASVWQYAQVGLAEAAYEIYTGGTHHIKVYFAIRPEALSEAVCLCPQTFRNVSSYITDLSYSKDDLERMYCLYIQNEADANLAMQDYKFSDPSRAFLGVTQIEHGYIERVSESVFDYVYRHTMQRPYDIMRICRALYRNANSTAGISVENIRHFVNEEASGILEAYVHELGYFVPTGVDTVFSVAKLLNCNVLGTEFMRISCATLNGTTINSVGCNMLCEKCYNAQPFTTLYNLGLLGVISSSPSHPTSVQSFLNSGKGILDLHKHELPVSQYYFVHPALADYARKERERLGLTFKPNKVLVVGNCCNYDAMDSNKKKRLRTLVKASVKQLMSERVFVSSTIEDLKPVRKRVREALELRGLHPIMSEEPNFGTEETASRHSHDHCIAKLLDCNSFVFIFGREYGGIYEGYRYEEERKEIVQRAMTAGKTITPSISMLEFYVAKKSGILCHAFIDLKLQQDIRNRDSSVNENVRAMYNFFNHWNEGDGVCGNWISPYNSLDDLQLRIKNIRFDERRRKSRRTSTGR